MIDPIKFHNLIKQLDNQPIIAILRGISPEQSVDIASAIYAADIKTIEVPLTDEMAMSALALLIKNLPDDCFVGAGTVTTLTQLEQLITLKVSFIVSPNTDETIISKAIEHGIVPIPGIATPTEAYKAYQAGAKLLKVFPAASFGPSHISALRTVLPDDCQLIAVGGVNIKDRKQWQDAGARALGIGKDLYATGDTLQDVTKKLAHLTHPIE